MSNQLELRRRAKTIAERYFSDCLDWPTEHLIDELETMAYRVARQGDNREATRLFVLVAELSRDSVTGSKSEVGNSPRPQLLQRTRKESR